MLNQLIVVGLGNPGEKYEYTRHNIGHLFIDYLVQQYKLKKTPAKGAFYLYKKNLCQVKLLLVKTRTFMNISDEAVISVVRQFNATPKELLVVCDDFNLPYGTIRLRLRGSDGGQKGLRSIITRLGTQEIPRLRLGIGVDEPFDPIDFVLTPFSENEKESLTTIFNFAKRSLETYICNGPQKAMSEFNKNVLDVK
ncbi:MAG: aminoacyl-tRNA hydrolase [Calditrichia bacterium]